MTMTENKIFDKKEISQVLLVGIDLSQPDFYESMDELRELTTTAGGNIVGQIIQKRRSIDKNHVLGPGKLEEIKDFIKQHGINLVIFNDNLAPSQVVNIENIIDCRVIDRTILILDIFAQRARTAEGKLQVEAAQLKYLQPRLVGRRADLSRLAGGIGTRGPGETKLETDRRYIREKIRKLDEEIEKLAINRSLFRAKRIKNENLVSIFGYTNAGKSTLLNTLTNADVYAEDKLFATLDTTTRRVEFESGTSALLTDTVGFIRDLPHEIVKAFKSTLEEAVFADLVLLVADVSDEQCKEKIEVTKKTLEEIGAISKQIVVYNKCDKYAKDFDNNLLDDSIFVSAKTGFGLDLLKKKIEEFFDQSMIEMQLIVPYQNFAILSKINKDEILSFENLDDGAHLKIKIDQSNKYIKEFKKFVR
ncbi:MAG: GTPase HflX [Clostridia bacterium]|nr:GTPase HflX [Clostridia bacterium]